MFLISCLILIACALIGRDNLYQEYGQKEDLLRTPILTYPLAGIYDGIMPWKTLEYLPYFQERQNDTLLTESNLSDEVISGGESFNLLSANPDTNGGSLTELPDEPEDTSADDQTTIGNSATNAPANPNSPDSPNISQTDFPDDANPIAEDPQPEYGPDGLPIVHYIQVDESYFNDAVFIGDSRTRSLELYSGLENTTFLSDIGLTIYTVLDKKLTPSDSSSKTTVRDYLSTHQFQKVYLMLGVNELGTGTAESFANTYLEVIHTIRELQPDATIYIQAILHLSEEKDAEGTYINNASIIERNAILQTFADNTNIFWLDANEVLCDENGYLIADYTFDGVHLQAKYVPIWLDWLMAHALEERTTEIDDATSEITADADMISETASDTDPETDAAVPEKAVGTDSAIDGSIDTDSAN